MIIHLFEVLSDFKNLSDCGYFLVISDNNMIKIKKFNVKIQSSRICCIRKILGNVREEGFIGRPWRLQYRAHLEGEVHKVHRGRK